VCYGRIFWPVFGELTRLGRWDSRCYCGSGHHSADGGWGVPGLPGKESVLYGEFFVRNLLTHGHGVFAIRTHDKVSMQIYRVLKRHAALRFHDPHDAWYVKRVMQFGRASLMLSVLIAKFSRREFGEFPQESTLVLVNGAGWSVVSSCKQPAPTKK
jgi:hypothetical protein